MDGWMGGWMDIRIGGQLNGEIGGRMDEVQIRDAWKERWTVG